MFRVSLITKGAIRAAAVIAVGVGSLVPFALGSMPAGASGTKASHPVHPSTFVALFQKVSATQEQNCKYPTGLYMGAYYCGGFKVDTSLTYKALYQKVSATQEQNCKYPTGLYMGAYYCGGYVKTSSLSQ